MDRLAAEHATRIGLVLRDGRLLPTRGDTVLRAGDEAVVAVDPDHGPDSTDVFEGRDPGARRSA